MDLTIVWFVAIAVLWTGYFVLEGFDFGVGVMSPVIGRNDRERRVVINTIGPHFDGNEVWLITAAGAMFAAFPEWYATVFSGFYLPLLLILVALIVRLVAIDYRSKRRELAWRRRWDAGIAVGSALPAVLWGVAFGNIVAGVPVDADGEYVGTLLSFLNPYALLTGLTMLVLFAAHGSVFTTLKTAGVVRDRAAGYATGLLVAATGLVAVHGVWSWVSHPHGGTAVLTAVSVLGLLGAVAAHRRGRDGFAFAGTALAVATLVAGWFVGLFPRLLPSTLDPAWSLTIANASSTPYTLTILSIAALVILPLVLAYQAWSYWVFRRRLSTSSIRDDVLVPAGQDRSWPRRP